MSEQFGNYVDRGPESLESKQSLFYAARGNLFAALCGLMEGGPDREVVHMADVLYDYVFEIVDRFDEVTDHMLRDGDVDGWLKFYLNDEISYLTELRNYSGQLVFMPTDSDDLRERAQDYMQYADFRNEVEENESDVYCDRLISTLHELIMEYGPIESQEAFIEAFDMGEDETEPLMVLTGNLQIDTVIDALRYYNSDSSTLAQLLIIRETIESDQTGTTDDLPVTIDFDDAETQTEILEALGKMANDDDRDMFDRIAAEELLAMQQPVE